MGSGALFLAVFLACAVEAVEAATIVLAMGTARDWRSALAGVAAALASLSAIVAVLGPALTVLPLQTLRLVVGGLLLAFGLQWLRKAVLRAGGRLPLHDEGAIYRRELAAAGALEARPGRWITDWYAFVLSFKGCLLEGLEVAFIALTFGSNQHDLLLAAVAALVAVAVVAVAAFAVRAPLARMPENTMKFTVGVMLTGFGVFWGAEGAGVHWPGADLALPILVVGIAVYAAGLAGLLRVLPAAAGVRPQATRVGSQATRVGSQATRVGPSLAEPRPPVEEP